MPPYLLVVLDENGTIVDFQCDMEGIDYEPQQVIGKNWFDLFIDPADKERIFTVFKEILEGKDREYETYKNDILAKNGSHKLIDFYNKLLTHNGKRYTFSVGLEHYTYEPSLLKELALQLYESLDLFK